MPHASASLLIRFWAGALGSAALGAAVFRWGVIDPERAAFQCITVGLLASGIVTLVRIGHERAAIGLALLFAVVRFGALRSADWPDALRGALVGLLLGGGLVIVAVVNDALARRGLRVGKFLIVGPLVGGLFLALTPLSDFGAISLADPASNWLFNTLLGLIIGDGVAAGVELAELVLLRGERPPDPGPAPNATGDEPGPGVASTAG